MDPRAILLPVCGQVLLTLIVWIVLYITRVGMMKKKRIHPQVLADDSQAQVLLKDVVNPSDNFENLFELPVLFYIAALIISTNGITDLTYVVLAWGYVGFRAIHSLIHCSYNKIMHRFYAYLTSSLLLWGIWARLAWQIFS